MRMMIKYTLFAVLAILFFSGCSTAPTPVVDPNQPVPATPGIQQLIQTPSSPVSVEIDLTNPKIMFQSNRDGDLGWFIMNPDGSGVQKLTFPNLVNFRLTGIKWIADLDTFVVLLMDENFQEDLYLMDVSGVVYQRLTDTYFGESLPEYSPVSETFAFTCIENDLDVCTVTRYGTNPINHTFIPSRDGGPIWMPSGQEILYISQRGGVPGLWIVNLDGTGLRTLSEGLASPEESPAISPDGQWLVYQSQRQGKWDIYMNNLTGTNLIQLTNHPGADTGPLWSPSGDYVLYKREHQGQIDLYVVSFSGGQPINITNTSDVSERAYMWDLERDIVYYVSDEAGNLDIYSVNWDGSNKVNITSNNVDDFDIAWMGH